MVDREREASMRATTMWHEARTASRAGIPVSESPRFWGAWYAYRHLADKSWTPEPETAYQHVEPSSVYTPGDFSPFDFR